MKTLLHKKKKKSELLNEAKQFKTTTAIILTGLLGTEQI